MRKTCWALVVAIVLAFPLGCGHPTTMVGLTVTPTTAGVVGEGVAGQIQFKALGQFVHPTETRDVTNQVAWSSAIPNVVTVNQQGLATSGLACGVSTITATAGEPLIGNVGTGAIVTATASFTVANPANTSCPQTIP
jgi:hypothetical protein